MRLLALILQASRARLALTVLFGVLSGVGSALLISLINEAVSRGPGLPMPDLALRFAVVGALALGSRLTSQMMLNRLQQTALFELRMRLSRRILTTPLRHLEETGAARLLATLTDDILVLSHGLTVLPDLLINTAIVVGCLAYLAWLSWTAFFAMVVLMTLGLLTYWAPTAASFRLLRRARDTQDTLFQHFRALTEGLKELKLNQPRRKAFLGQELGPTAESLRHLHTRSNDLEAASTSWGLFLFFIVIGLLLFALPHFSDVGTQALTGYTLTVLYLQKPLDAIMFCIPFLGRASVALDKIQQLKLNAADVSEKPEPPAPCLSFSRLELRGVTHTYHHEHEDGRFTLGPIHLTLRRGELLFLIGGNGSGKTTLAKLFTGLYTPEGGEILLDGQPVTEAWRDRYRQHFSTVFSDFYLFEHLLGIAPEEQRAHIGRYLSRLQLDRKVSISDGTLSTTQLSQGQRKRLALLTAYLEDRPIYIFDEWAADQDPTFKRIFYEQLLPDLKHHGKAVLVITHDDRYFPLADRIVRLENGQLLQDETSSEAFAPPADTRATP